VRLFLPASYGKAGLPRAFLRFGFYLYKAPFLVPLPEFFLHLISFAAGCCLYIGCRKEAFKSSFIHSSRASAIANEPNVIRDAKKAFRQFFSGAHTDCGYNGVSLDDFFAAVSHADRHNITINLSHFTIMGPHLPIIKRYSPDKSWI
jgi:hypothetical protein